LLRFQYEHPYFQNLLEFYGKGVGMEAHRSPDRFRLREIEQQLTAKLHLARERLRLVSTEEGRRAASISVGVALDRLTEFVARRIVPPEFL
jgi:hypothetical protein